MQLLMPDAEYYARNKERLNADVLEWKRNNRDRKLKKHYEYVSENRDRRNATVRRHYAKDPSKRLIKNHNRRAGRVGVVTQDEWEHKLKEFNDCCAYCDSPGKMTMDHIVPLSRGGVHLIENVVPACFSCNSSKKDKLLFEEWTPPNARMEEVTSNTKAPVNR